MTQRGNGRGRPQPFIVKQDGTIHDRKTGERIGDVNIRNGLWTGRLLGPKFPADPWDQETVDPMGAGKRWSVARAVWRAHLKKVDAAPGEP